VSYAWEFTDRARIQFRALGTWLQERTLDEIDAVAASPNPSGRPRRSDEFVRDFVAEHEGKRHYIFLTLSLDEIGHVLRIVTIGSYSRIA
jgi:hypothetical protein